MTRENVAELDRARSELGVDIAALSAGLTSWGFAERFATDDFDKVVADARRSTLDAADRDAAVRRDALARRRARLLRPSEEMARGLPKRASGSTTTTTTSSSRSTRGACLLDIIADSAPNIGLEIDVHWVQQRRRRPGRTHPPVRRPGRDGAPEGLPHRSVPAEALEALQQRDTRLHTAFAEVVQFAEVGEGNLDFAAIIERASNRCGVPADRTGRPVRAIRCTTPEDLV